MSTVGWVIAGLLAAGVLTVPIGAGLMDSGPGWLGWLLARGGIVLLAAGVALAVVVALTA